MYSAIEICVSSICLAVSLICGGLMWVKRREVSDRSRIYLVIANLLIAATLFFIIIGAICGYRFYRTWTLLDPVKSIGGLYIITLFLCYPLEVMRPGQLRGYKLLLLWLPSLIVTLPLLFGVHFRLLYSWSDLWNHLLEWDVLFRMLSTVFLCIFSLQLLFIPYNWSQSSVDNHWIRRFTFFSQVITILYLGHVFTDQPLWMILHISWGIFVGLYIVYYELRIRLLPPAKSETKPLARLSSAEKPTTTVVSAAAEESGDYWPMICQVMDEWEMWRNPNTTVETVSKAVGTNRIYVARCIKEHTGMTFNDYMNEKRIAYMASQLRLNPKQDHKHLYFEVGFRNRQTAYRNFVKFQGYSPTEYTSSF